MQKRDSQHKFLQHKGAHTERNFQKKWPQEISRKILDRNVTSKERRFSPRLWELGGAIFLPKILSQMALQRCNVIFFRPISGVEFRKGEFLEGEFFRRALLLEKTESINSTQEFGSKIRAYKIRFPEFGPKFGFRRRKIPLCGLLSLKNSRNFAS